MDQDLASCDRQYWHSWWTKLIDITPNFILRELLGTKLRISNFNSWPNVVEDKVCWLIEVRSAKMGQLDQLKPPTRHTEKDNHIGLPWSFTNMMRLLLSSRK